MKNIFLVAGVAAVSVGAFARAESQVVCKLDVTADQVRSALEACKRNVATTQPTTVRLYFDLLRNQRSLVVPPLTPSAPRGMSDYLRIPDAAVLKNEGANTWHYVIPLGGHGAVVPAPQR